MRKVKLILAALLLGASYPAYACGTNDLYGWWIVKFNVDNGENIQCIVFVTPAGAIKAGNSCSVLNAGGAMLAAVAIAGNLNLNGKCDWSAAFTDSNSVSYNLQGGLSRDGNRIIAQGYTFIEQGLPMRKQLHRRKAQ